MKLKNSDPSLFTEIFCNTPSSRILGLFMEGKELDFPLTDISRETGLNRQRVSEIIKLYLKKGLIVKTRTLGRMQMYKWNMNDKVANALTKVFDEIMWKAFPTKNSNASFLLSHLKNNR